MPNKNGKVSNLFGREENKTLLSGCLGRVGCWDQVTEVAKRREFADGGSRRRRLRGFRFVGHFARKREDEARVVDTAQGLLWPNVVSLENEKRRRARFRPKGKLSAWEGLVHGWKRKGGRERGLGLLIIYSSYFLRFLQSKWTTQKNTEEA